MVVATAVAALMIGCGEQPQATNIVCADFEKTTDPAKKEELLKKCPRIGPAFKPSDKKVW